MTALWLAFILTTIDGDTVRARVQLWPEITIETSIRLAGIDTPELRGKCAEEKRRALVARDALSELLKGRTVSLSAIEPDKYGGRVLAHLRLADGADVAATLIAQGHAVAYTGRGPKHDWCR